MEPRYEEHCSVWELVDALPHQLKIVRTCWCLKLDRFHLIVEVAYDFLVMLASASYFSVYFVEELFCSYTCLQKLSQILWYNYIFNYKWNAFIFPLSGWNVSNVHSIKQRQYWLTRLIHLRFLKISCHIIFFWKKLVKALVYSDSEVPNLFAQ